MVTCVTTRNAAGDMKLGVRGPQVLIHPLLTDATTQKSVLIRSATHTHARASRMFRIRYSKTSNISLFLFLQSSPDTEVVPFERILLPRRLRAHQAGTALHSRSKKATVQIWRNLYQGNCEDDQWWLLLRCLLSMLPYDCSLAVRHRK